jgi:glycosyltransferase involved in cell wall biosynthesis
MRIGIDARELAGHPTGVGRYLGGLLREWSTGSAADSHEFVLYAHQPLTAVAPSRRIRHRLIAGAPGTWWEQRHLPPVADEDHLDVFFAPAYTAPLRLAVPTVVTIHDLSYVVHPEWFLVREGMRRRWLTRRSAARARAVITVSQFSKREIVEHLGTSADRVHVIPQGIDRPAGGSRRDGAPRVLYVGSIFNRRHVPDLVRAIARLARTHPDVSLDIVGDNRTFPHENLEDEIAGSGEGRVRWHRYASNEQLLELYSRAHAFAFLSEYEGLGTTPLEALAAAVPPVVADTEVARETYGDAALYVPVGDIGRTAEALELVLFDEATRARIGAAAPVTLAKFDWARAARETLAVLVNAF